MGQERLQKVREELNSIDSSIVDLLIRRSELAKEVALSKIESGDPSIIRPERENEIFEKLETLEKKHGFSIGFLRTMWWNIISESIKIQQETNNETRGKLK